MKQLAVCAAALFLLALSSCNSSNRAAPGAGVALKSEDGQYQLSLDKGWAAADFHLDNVRIGASNEHRGEYVEIIAELPSDYTGSFHDYARAKRDTMAASMENSWVTTGESLHVNDREGYRFEIHGLIPDSQVRIGYLLTVFKTKTHYIQVVAWSVEKNFSEDKGDLERLTQGFSELDSSQ